VSQTRDNKRGVKVSMLSSRLLDHVFVSRVIQTRDNKRGVKFSMLSSRMLDHVFLYRVSQTRDNKCGVKGSMHDLTDARRAWYPLHHVYCLWFDSHGTRTHDLRDARRGESNKRQYTWCKG
jgi:hypothetical protein